MRRSAVAAAGALFALPAVLLAYHDGPVPGVTGGFGEPTCAQCHQGKPPADRALTIAAPKTYRAGQTYRVRVTLARPGLEVGGFEVAARHRSGPEAGTQAGELRAADARAQVTMGKGVQYAQHTAAGSRATPPGTLTWVVVWRAPANAAGEVVFHIAANASNADSSALGDAIYTAVAVARPVRSTTTMPTAHRPSPQASPGVPWRDARPAFGRRMPGEHHAHRNP